MKNICDSCNKPVSANKRLIPYKDKELCTFCFIEETTIPKENTEPFFKGYKNRFFNFKSR